MSFDRDSFIITQKRLSDSSIPKQLYYQIMCSTKIYELLMLVIFLSFFHDLFKMLIVFSQRSPYLRLDVISKHDDYFPLESSLVSLLAVYFR